MNRSLVANTQKSWTRLAADLGGQGVALLTSTSAVGAAAGAKDVPTGVVR